jgi:hypothetical protein
MSYTTRNTPEQIKLEREIKDCRERIRTSLRSANIWKNNLNKLINSRNELRQNAKETN